MRTTMLRYQTPALLVLALGVLACIEFAVPNESLRLTLAEMFIRVTVVVGLYVFVGNSGIISFGHIGFMCIGAYAAAWATAEPTFKSIMLQGLPPILQENQFPFAVAMLGAILLPAAVALVLGIALMRLAGVASSIATFAFLIIVNNVYSNWDGVTAGVSSIVGIPAVVGPWTAFGFAALAVIVAHLLQISRYGLMLKASRDNEVAARASGVNILRMRLVAFVVSAAIVGAGGGLAAQFLGILTVDSFYLSLTFITLAMLVVGGMSSLSGAVLGVVAVTAIIEVLRVFERGVSLGGSSVALPAGGQEIGLGVVMALILIFRPSGLSAGRELAVFANDPMPEPVAPPGLPGRPTRQAREASR